jgi:hypothetical protein
MASRSELPCALNDYHHDVNRIEERFDDDFTFQLTAEEWRA